MHSICQQIWKTQQCPQDWKRPILIPIPKKSNVRECSNYNTIALVSHASKVMLKSLQARCQQLSVSVQLLSRVWLFATPSIAARQASRPSPTPGVHSNSCPSSWWCHPDISTSVIPFSSSPQSLPASESFPMSQLFTWGGQSTGVSALASFLPKKSQDWSPLGWTGWISLQSKGLSRVFSNTTVQKHQFFGAQLPSQSNSHIHTWLLEKP